MKYLIQACILSALILANQSMFANEILTPVERKVYALVVGINQYKNAQVNDLGFSVSDAEKMFAFLETGKMGLVQPENLVLLTNEMATKKAILKSLDALSSKANDEDLLLFYFIGHGEKTYLLPSDFINDLSVSFLTYDEIKAVFKKSKANLKLLIVNACYAGSIKTHQIQPSGNRLAAATDTSIVFVSSRENELSWETSDFQQSVFSYFLIKGLSGDADSDSNKRISLEELYYYVRNQTYQYVKEHIKKEQCPMMYGKFDPQMILSDLNSKQGR